MKKEKANKGSGTIQKRKGKRGGEGGRGGRGKKKKTEKKKGRKGRQMETWKQRHRKAERGPRVCNTGGYQKKRERKGNQERRKKNVDVRIDTGASKDTGEKKKTEGRGPDVRRKKTNTPGKEGRTDNRK